MKPRDAVAYIATSVLVLLLLTEVCSLVWAPDQCHVARIAFLGSAVIYLTIGRRLLR